MVRALRAQPGQQSLLVDIENHYGLSGFSTYADQISISGPSPAWRAATDPGWESSGSSDADTKAGRKTKAVLQSASSKPSEVPSPSLSENRPPGPSQPVSKHDKQHVGAKGPPGEKQQLGARKGSATEDRLSYSAITAATAAAPGGVLKDVAGDTKKLPAGATGPMGREAAASIVAHDLSWKLQLVAAAACSTFIHAHVISEACGGDAVGAIRLAAAEVPLVGDKGGSGNDETLTAASLSSSGLLERLQLTRDMIMLQREAFSLGRAPRQVADAIFQETRRLAAAGPKKQPSLQQQQQQSGVKPGGFLTLFTPWAVRSADDALIRLQRCSRGLWALLFTSAAWGACPPADLFGEVVAPLAKRLLEPAKIGEVRSA